MKQYKQGMPLYSSSSGMAIEEFIKILELYHFVTSVKSAVFIIEYEEIFKKGL